MILFSIFLTFFALAAANSDGCSQGENFWCENVENAKACGAFEHCLSNVWITMTIEDGDCEDGVNVMQRILKHQAEPCDVLSGSHKKNCNHVTRNHPEEVQALAKSNLKSKAVAKLLGLCGNVKVKEDSKLCHDCKALLRDIEDLFIGPEVEAQAVQQLKEMCQELPDQIDQYCESVAVDWIQNLFSFLKQQMPVDLVCETFILCAEETETKSDNLDIFELIKVYQKEYANNSVVSDAACNTCQAVIGDMKGLIDDSEFKTEVDSLLQEIFCTFLPGSIKTACITNVQDVSNIFFDIMSSELDPLVLCELFGMCRGKTHLANAIADNLNPLIDAVEFFADVTTKKAEPVLQVLNPFLEKFASWGVTSSECGVCEVMVKEVINILRSQESKRKFVNSVQKMCGYLPEPLASECKGFVTSHGGEIIDMFISTITPKMVCQAIGMCDDIKAVKKAPVAPVLATILKSSIEKPATLAPPQEKPKKVAITPWCEICEMMATIASQFINSKELEQIMVGVGQGMCDMFEGATKLTCNTMVRHFMDALLGDMTQIVVPDFICGVIGVCEINLTPMHYNTKPFFNMSSVINHQE